MTDTELNLLRAIGAAVGKLCLAEDRLDLRPEAECIIVALEVEARTHYLESEERRSRLTQAIHDSPAARSVLKK